MEPEDLARPPDPLDAETDPRFPSGKWVGFWTQDARLTGRPKMELLLTFRKKEISGEGRDPIGHFLIRGFYSTEDGRCRWTKKYVGKHDVYYQGFNEGKGIWGTWEIAAAHKGGFHIWPEGTADPSSPTLKAEADLPVEAAVGEPVAAG
jgi:hypothetical protein